jgi:hypothetical protein
MSRTACTEPQCLYIRAIPLLPLWAVRPVQSLSACTRVRFTLLQLCKIFLNVQSTEIDPFSMPDQSLERNVSKMSTWMTGQTDKSDSIVQKSVIRQKTECKFLPRMAELNVHDCINLKPKNKDFHLLCYVTSN